MTIYRISLHKRLNLTPQQQLTLKEGITETTPKRVIRSLILKGLISKDYTLTTEGKRITAYRK